MNLTVMLLIAAVTAGADSTADRGVEARRFQVLHGHWRTLHQEAARENRKSNAVLVVDPRQGRLWVQNDPSGRSEMLPAGLNWVAYHVTARGIREISFPVRIRHLRLELKNAEDDEQILIYGSSKKGSWNCSVSSGTKGHAFTQGSSSGAISSVNLSLPALKAGSPVGLPMDSFAIFQDDGERQWAETLRNKWFTVTVARTTPTP